ncbi:MAG: hypothetical protein KUG72_01635 [Pseudomonadales bacterium]|nr:hypothetical protein [Pseudomonadales bacterium]
MQPVKKYDIPEKNKPATPPCYLCDFNVANFASEAQKIAVLRPFFVAYSGGIELVQPYVNRYCGRWCFPANTAGMVFGIVIAVLLNHIVQAFIRGSEA